MAEVLRSGSFGDIDKRFVNTFALDSRMSWDFSFVNYESLDPETPILALFDHLVNDHSALGKDESRCQAHRVACPAEISHCGTANILTTM